MSIDRLSAEDRLMLRASEIWPQDNGALAILDGTSLLDSAGRFRIDAVRAAIEARLRLAPRFRQVIYTPRRGLGGPLWVDDPSFDLSEHVRVHPLAAPAGEADLLRATEQLRRQPLDPSRPLWEMWLMTGLPERRIGLFVRMHHAIADGIAALAMISALLDTVPDAPPASAPPWRPAPVPSARALLADSLRRRLQAIAAAFAVLARPRTALRQVLGALPALRELFTGEPVPKTSLDRLVGADRNISLVRSRLDLVRAIAHACDATVNDVLLAVTAGGLRALLRSRGEAVDGLTLRIYVPVSLRRERRAAAQGNLIAQMVVPLPLGVTDPTLRLRQIAAETARRKARSRTSLGMVFRGGIVERLMLKAVIRQRVNVTSANIRGPEQPLYLAGAQVLEVFPLITLIGNVTIAVGALSYAGAFNVGLVGDRAACPDLDVLAAGLRDELDALAASTGVSADVTTVAGQQARAST